MTVTAESPAVDTLDDLTIACTSCHGCDADAEWVLTFACCTRMSFLCSHHLQLWLARERRAVAGHNACCWNCRRVIDRLEDTARWERL